MESMEHPFQTNKSSQNPGSQASYHSGHKSNPNPGKPVKEMKNSKIFLRKLYEKILVLKKKKDLRRSHGRICLPWKRHTTMLLTYNLGTKLFINCLVHSGDGLWKNNTLLQLDKSQPQEYLTPPIKCIGSSTSFWQHTIWYCPALAPLPFPHGL